MTNSWRALARMARDRLVTTDPSNLAAVLNVRAHPLDSAKAERQMLQPALASSSIVPCPFALVQPDVCRDDQSLQCTERH